MKKFYLDKVKILQKVVIANPEKKILALRRRLNDYNRSGAWDLAGGNIDEGDRNNFQEKTNLAVEAIKREAKEETGLGITNLKPIFIDSGVNKKGILVFLTAYQAKTNLSKVDLSDEHIEYRWVTKEEFGNLDVGEEGEFLKKIVRRVVVS